MERGHIRARNSGKRKSAYALVYIAFVVVAISLIAALAKPEAVDAAGCVRDDYTSSDTADYLKQCVGNAGSEAKYYQLVVRLSADDSSATVTAKNASGDSISFTRISGDNRTFASIPGGGADPTLGYRSDIAPDGMICNNTGRNNITISVKVSGKSTQTQTINLCDNLVRYTIYTNFEGPSGGTTTTGCISGGQLGILRDTTTVPLTDAQRMGSLEKKGVTYLKVSGPTSYTLTDTSQVQGKTTVSLSNGALRINDLKPGTYTVELRYNDQLVLNDDMGVTDGSYTSYTGANYVFSDSGILVSASTACGQFADDADLWLSSTTSNKVDPTTLLEEIEAATPPSTCAIGGLGWVICPAITFISTMNDAMYGTIQSFLVVDSRMFDVAWQDGDSADSANPTKNLYNIWKDMRNIANVVFVIAFLFIIYAQMASGGGRA